MNVAIVGAGAAGFFSAITAKQNFPDADVVVFEKSKKYLSKVKVSGGGRCNVTNGCTTIKQLCDGYPRGAKQLKKAFKIFNNKHTIEWFEKRGIALKTENDNRVFPISNSSQSIIDCLLHELKRLGVNLELEKNVTAIIAQKKKLILQFSNNEQITFDKVVIASGGSPKKDGLNWLKELGHEIIDPAPSLFTFNMPDESITKLMGVQVSNAIVSVEGSKLKSNGPLLITHWGMSGPAILKLSSFGARILKEKEYQFNIHVNWANELNQDEVQTNLEKIIESNPKKQLSNIKPYDLPERLWLYILERSNLALDKPWEDLGKKSLNKLITVLTNDIYTVNGKTTFKEEFVTCGGISLESIDFNTMQSKVCKNLYFAGEILDIDGVTGGYNFQAAWTTAYIAGKLL